MKIEEGKTYDVTFRLRGGPDGWAEPEGEGLDNGYKTFAPARIELATSIVEVKPPLKEGDIIKGITGTIYIIAKGTVSGELKAIAIRSDNGAPYPYRDFFPIPKEYEVIDV